jgi:hypothetical protein
MPAFPPIEEQLRNANMVLRVADQPLVHELILRYAEEHPRNGNGCAPGVIAPPASISDAVSKVLPLLIGEFTYKDVVERVLELGYQFAAIGRRTAVGRVLRKLVNQGVIEEVKKGEAGEPSVYRRR